MSSRLIQVVAGVRTSFFKAASYSMVLMDHVVFTHHGCLGCFVFSYYESCWSGCWYVCFYLKACLWFVVLVVKNLSPSAGDIRDMGSVPGLGRYPGGGHSNPLQYSCLENPMDRGAWQASPWGHKELDTTVISSHQP